MYHTGRRKQTFPKRPQSARRSPKTTPDGPKMPQDDTKIQHKSKIPQQKQKSKFSLSFYMLLSKTYRAKSAENRHTATPLPGPSPVVAYAFKTKLHLAGRSLSVIRRGFSLRACRCSGIDLNPHFPLFQGRGLPLPYPAL